MAEINKVTQSGVPSQYLRQVLADQKVRQQERIQQEKAEEVKRQEEDRISISEEARQLAEAQQFYKKFLEEKAKEIERERIEKVKELKQKMAQKPETPLRLIAEKISQELLGL